MKNYVAVCLAVMLAMALAVPSAGAIEEKTAAEAAQPAGMSEAKEMSIYGEVQAVNVQNSSISVQYYDYDSDEEKNIEIISDKNTKIENAAALDKINKGDWVDVAYEVSEGKNIAKSIMVEKEEAFAEPIPEQTPAEPEVE